MSEIILVNTETGESITPLVNPLDFNLEVEKAMTIESAFMPKRQELASLQAIYSSLVGAEITPELVSQAKDFLKTAKKVRTSTEKIHKAEKSYYWNAGKFVDSLKNKIYTSVEEMEKGAEEIAFYFEKQEEKRRIALRDERWTELSKFTDSFPPGLDVMDENTYQMTLAGAKAMKEQREKEAKEAAERAELERKKQEEERKQLEEQLRIEREKARIAQEEANRLAAIARKEQEEKDRQLRLEREKAEALARQGEKAQLAAWIETFDIAPSPVDNPSSKLIQEKFNAFKEWAKKQI